MISGKKIHGLAVLLGLCVLTGVGVLFVAKKTKIQINPSQKTLLDRIEKYNSGIQPVEAFWSPINALDTIEYLLKDGTSGWHEIIKLYFDPAMDVESLGDLSASDRLQKLYLEYKEKFEIVAKWLKGRGSFLKIDSSHIDLCGRSACFTYDKVVGNKDLSICFVYTKKGWIFSEFNITK